MSDERERAVLHLLFLSGLVSNALVYYHIDQNETALHQVDIAKNIVRVCDGELTLDDVRQEALDV